MKKKDFKIKDNINVIRTIKNVEYIPVDIYKANVFIFRKNTLKQLSKYWDIEKDCVGITKNFLEENGNVIIYLGKNPTKEYISHELCHATQMIMHSIGHKHCGKEADEPFAYLLGYLVKEFYKK